MKKLLATLAVASVASFVASAADEPTKVCVFKQGENNSLFYRIPALVRANDNSLIAVADQRATAINDLPNTISVVYKRSTDNGVTWSEMGTIAQGDKDAGKTYGDPAVVKDETTGTLLCIYSGDTGFWYSTKTNRAGFYLSKSTDNGVTWSEPKAFTDQVYQSTWRGAFAASGRALQLKSGRIMFVASAHCSDTWGATTYNYVCYTDDLGDTWKVANPNTYLPSSANGNEAKLMELENGDLFMSIRSTTGYRLYSKSTDGGTTWSAATSISTLPDPGCNGDIIRYPSTDGKTRLIHSLPASTSVRQNVSVYLSYDEGTTWNVSKQLIDGYSAYSSLEVLDDGTIGCLVEEGKWDSNIAGDDGFDLYFMNFSLDWLAGDSEGGEGGDNGNGGTEGGDNGSTNSDAYAHYDGAITYAERAERCITNLKVSDGTNSVDVAGPGSGTSRQVYTDQSATVLETTPGSTLSFTVTGGGTWMHTYVYIDYNNDGVFTPDLASNGAVTSDSELVSFNAYNSGSSWVNSLGTTVDNCQSITAPNLPAITLPSNLAAGDYRVRYKVDWNSIDPFGNQETGNLIQYNCGIIIDFTIRILKSTGVDNIASENENAPVEYFNLNGIQVNNDNLTPGMYISRQGSKAQKVVIK